MKSRCLLIGSVAMTSLLGQPVAAGPREDAVKVFTQWTELFNAGDLDGLLATYTPDASVHGTTSPNLAIGAEALKAYFTPALRAKNQVKAVGDPVVAEAGAGAVVLSGYYEFAGTRADGQSFAAPARYSFVVVGSGATARIAHQHSSPRPRPTN